MKNSLGQNTFPKLTQSCQYQKKSCLELTDYNLTNLYIMRTIGFLKVWRVANGELLNVIHAHDQEIRGLCVTKDGQYIATASEDETIKVWKADRLNLEATLVGHTEDVTCVVATGMM